MPNCKLYTNLRYVIYHSTGAIIRGRNNRGYSLDQATKICKLLMLGHQWQILPIALPVHAVHGILVHAR